MYDFVMAECCCVPEFTSDSRYPSVPDAGVCSYCAAWNAAWAAEIANA